VSAPQGSTDDAAFRETLKEASVSPLWDVMAALVTETPKPRAIPHVWSYDTLRPKLMEAGKRITAEKAERRVLILENPGTGDDHTVTDAMYAGLQLVLPDETHGHPSMENRSRCPLSIWC